MKCIVTGVAGFIGYHLCEALLAAGYDVLGIDSLNDYYSPELKRARLDRLLVKKNFHFEDIDLSDHEVLSELNAQKNVEIFIHLAAQAGVRYSLDHPFDYLRSNLAGHLSVLEFCRHAPKLNRLIYASSSSVYGDAHTAPFREDVNINQPKSLYASTKASNELMSASYASLFGIPQIGLRFFTVYGAWGRPDMAYWLFTDRILRGDSIKVFNHGQLKRDFTYVDDVIDGLMAITGSDLPFEDGKPPHKVYNIGNNKSVPLMEMIETLESVLGVEAKKEFLPMQKGDVLETCADISAINKDYGFQPKVSLKDGLPVFCDWFKAYHQIS